jgi:hypothetical protein
MITLPADYQDRLISEICSRGYDGHKVYGDGDAIYIHMPDMDVYCTPGFEGDWSGLPIEIVDDEGTHRGEFIPTRSSGDVSADYETWHVAVTDYLCSMLEHCWIDIGGAE